ncbi:MAG: SGNH/GDSL hydrolase family protein [Clostridia bacterium]|nr:SGNH/GDSL hydrolase family protein [Clostridia bacterium]
MSVRLKRILAAAAAIIVLVLIFAFLQALLVPKYMESTQEGAMIAEYYDEPVSHDVLFVGDCEVYECFIPSVLYQEYGITSYVRGSAQQLIWQSYYLLEEMLERESPKVVIYSVMALKYGTPQNEAYNRMTLDGMQWSKSKWNAIKASMTEGENMLSYIFPILRFHSRWSDLSSEDFTYLFSKDPVTYGGYLPQTGVVPKTSTREGDKLKDYRLPETSMAYLDKMLKLCRSHGAELVLLKSPTNSWKYWWYDAWDEQVFAWADEHQVGYYNLIPSDWEIGLDWDLDTYDGGIHLNLSGAEKLSSWFGKILKNDVELPDRRGQADTDDYYGKMAERLNQLKEKNQNEQD